MSLQHAQNRAGRYESLAMRLYNERMQLHRSCENLHVCPAPNRDPTAPKFEWPSDWNSRECVMCFDSIPVDSAEFLKEKSDFAVCFPCYAYLQANVKCDTRAEQHRQ